VGKAKYFSPRDWTTQITLNPLGKLDFTRIEFRACGTGLVELIKPNASPVCPSGKSGGRPDAKASKGSEYRFDASLSGTRRADPAEPFVTLDATITILVAAHDIGGGIALSNLAGRRIPHQDRTGATRQRERADDSQEQGLRKLDRIEIFHD
jgi:hypothetical protein